MILRIKKRKKKVSNFGVYCQVDDNEGDKILIRQCWLFPVDVSRLEGRIVVLRKRSSR